MNYYSITLRSTTDGRSFTQELKTPKLLTSAVVKSFYEKECNVELVAFKQVEYFESSYTDNQRNITYTGIVEVQGYDVPIHRKLLPLYKDLNFDVFSYQDFIKLETKLKILYGDTFKLKTVRFD